MELVGESSGHRKVQLGPQKTRRLEPLLVGKQIVGLHPDQYQLIALFDTSDKPQI